ncbi:MAG: septum formation initiator family protein [Clostridiales Family XIII bacterium]|jgi:cell division protein FtsB|nr:septum formation initiator family protein [Clostridiales Family XIII bacterium]
MARQNAKRQSVVRPDTGAQSRVIDIEEAQRLRRKRRAETTKRKRTEVLTLPSDNSERKSRSSGRRVVYLLVVIVMLTLSAISGVRILDLKAEESKAERALAIKTEEKARLEKELAMLNDPEYVEAQARAQLRMIKKDEVLYVIDDPAEDKDA